jgi:hypothetical protein
MKLYEFSILTEEEQYNIVWSFGSHVDTHINNNIAINLYVINDFYVEIYYDRVSNQILYKKHFKQGDLLDKYLNKIKL